MIMAVVVWHYVFYYMFTSHFTHFLLGCGSTLHPFPILCLSCWTRERSNEKLLEKSLPFLDLTYVWKEIGQTEHYSCYFTITIDVNVKSLRRLPRKVFTMKMVSYSHSIKYTYCWRRAIPWMEWYLHSSSTYYHFNFPLILSLPLF